jgi:hypothetical protein
MDRAHCACDFRILELLKFAETIGWLARALEQSPYRDCIS